MAIKFIFCSNLRRIVVIPMLEEYPRERRHEVAPLFDGHTWLKTVIRFAFNEGSGRIFVDNVECPEVCYLDIGFVFLGGDISSRNIDLVIQALPTGPQIIVPSIEWGQYLLQLLGGSVKRVPRIGFSCHSLDIEYLRHLKSNIPPDFKLERIDLETARTMPRQVAPAIPFFFGSPEAFIERGFGYCVKQNDEVISTAMTAMPYEKEFEIEVDTLSNPEYRRKGLATIVSAALIEEALLRNLTPIWDAANEPSKGLALKLGYSNPTPYDAYSITGS